MSAKEGSREKGIPRYLVIVLALVEFHPSLDNQIGGASFHPITIDLWGATLAPEKVESVNSHRKIIFRKIQKESSVICKLSIDQFIFIREGNALNRVP